MKIKRFSKTEYQLLYARHCIDDSSLYNGTVWMSGRIEGKRWRISQWVHGHTVSDIQSMQLDGAYTPAVGRAEKSLDRKAGY